MTVTMISLPKQQRRRRGGGGGGSVSWFQPLLLGLLMVTTRVQSQDDNKSSKICTSETNTFTARVDIHASERGYYVFEECGLDWINPTIGMEFGVTYTFIQKDRTNFWHPLDFSYFPDATHVGAELLDPRIDKAGGFSGSIPATTTSGGSTASSTMGAAPPMVPPTSCASNMTCPAPMYFLNDGYLGSYSNSPDDVGPVTTQQYDTGMTLYEDFFFKSMSTWTGYGTFSVKLNFDDEQYTEGDIFYYCRIHQFMAGRIKLLKNGVPVHPDDKPAMYFKMETPGEFDRMCGTYGLDAFQLPHPECPSRFVCDADEHDGGGSNGGGMRAFASCIDAMDCHMIIGMTTKVSSGTELALFLHQMIPHHQNAVNMAKALLQAGFLPCDDLTNTDDPYCIMQGLLYGIVNRQNHEIGVMSNVLAAMNLPPTDDCEVPVPNEEEESSNAFNEVAKTAATTTTAAAAGALLGAAAHLL